MTTKPTPELLATLSPAGKAANTFYATTEVNRRLEEIKDLLIYNPDLTELKKWLNSI